MNVMTTSGDSAWKRPAVFLAMVLCASSLVASCSNDESRLEMAKTRAESIIAALELYKSENSRYPPSLDKLCPGYMAKLPTPMWGDDWRYRLRGAGGQGFTIVAKQTQVDGPDHWYDSRSRQWYIDTH